MGLVGLAIVVVVIEGLDGLGMISEATASDEAVPEEVRIWDMCCMYLRNQYYYLLL